MINQGYYYDHDHDITPDPTSMIIQALSSSFSRPLYRGLDPIFGEMVGFQIYNSPYSLNVDNI